MHLFSTTRIKSLLWSNFFPKNNLDSLFASKFSSLIWSRERKGTWKKRAKWCQTEFDYVNLGVFSVKVSFLTIGRRKWNEKERRSPWDGLCRWLQSHGTGLTQALHMWQLPHEDKWISSHLLTWTLVNTPQTISSRSNHKNDKFVSSTFSGIS